MSGAIKVASYFQPKSWIETSNLSDQENILAVDDKIKEILPTEEGHLPTQVRIKSTAEESFKPIYKKYVFTQENITDTIKFIQDDGKENKYTPGEYFVDNPDDFTVREGKGKNKKPRLMFKSSVIVRPNNIHYFNEIVNKNHFTKANIASTIQHINDSKQVELQSTIKLYQTNPELFSIYPTDPTKLLFNRERIIIPRDDPDLITKIIGSYESNPRFTGGRSTLYNHLKQKYAGILQTHVTTYLRNSALHQIVRPVAKNIVNKPLIVNSPGRWAQIDLIDFSNKPSEHINNNLSPKPKMKYILTYIDLFSKYVEAQPLLDKRPETVYQGILEIFKRLKFIPRKLQSDRGSEFQKTFMEKVAEHPEFKTTGIDEYKSGQSIKFVKSISYNPSSQGAIERFNRTLKSKLYRIMVRYQEKEDKMTNIWADLIPDIVKNYNSSVHRITLQTPNVLNDPDTHPDIRKKAYKRIRANAESIVKKHISRKQFLQKDEDLKVGSSVRILLTALLTEERKLGSFRKNIAQNWTSKIYTIVTVYRPVEKFKRNSYVLSYNGHKERRRFFAHQLQLVDTKALINDIKKKKDRPKTFDKKNTYYVPKKIRLQRQNERRVAEQNEVSLNNVKSGTRITRGKNAAQMTHRLNKIPHVWLQWPLDSTDKKHREYYKYDIRRETEDSVTKNYIFVSTKQHLYDKLLINVVKQKTSKTTYKFLYDVTYNDNIYEVTENIPSQKKRNDIYLIKCRTKDAMFFGRINNQNAHTVIVQHLTKTDSDGEACLVKIDRVDWQLLDRYVNLSARKKTIVATVWIYPTGPAWEYTELQLKITKNQTLIIMSSKYWNEDIPLTLSQFNKEYLGSLNSPLELKFLPKKRSLILFKQKNTSTIDKRVLEDYQRYDFTYYKGKKNTESASYSEVIDWCTYHQDNIYR
jgi:transposase InsO family protein